MKKTNFANDILSDDNFVAYNEVNKMLGGAIKFRLPHGGIVIDFANIKDGGKSAELKESAKDYVSSIRLPYDVIALEISLDHADLVIVVTEANEDRIAFSGIFKERGLGAVWQEYGATGVLYPDLTNGYLIDESPTEKFGVKELNIALGGMAYCILSFLAALQCSNVSISEQSAPKFINKRREKKGKLPLFSYKILTIDNNNKSKSNGTGKGTHASPRVHLRRGHIRRLADKTVWVSPCVVGDKSKGVIHKDYKVV